MMHERSESFSIDRQGFLVRAVTPRSGDAYEHRCSPAVFEAVAHACEDAEEGFTHEEIVATTGLPHTQCAVAIAFMKERCSIETVGKRNYAPTGLHLDAMTEFHALREKPPK